MVKGLLIKVCNFTMNKTTRCLSNSFPLYNFAAVFQLRKIWGFLCRFICFPICLLLIEENFKCYKDYITTLLQILHTRLDGSLVLNPYMPNSQPVLQKIETAEKIKVTKLSKIKQYMYKLIRLFLVDAENACTIWWCGSL